MDMSEDDEESPCKRMRMGESIGPAGPVTRRAGGLLS